MAEILSAATRALRPLEYVVQKADPVSGGGNNRAFRLKLVDGRSLFLKVYFKHPDDPRDRLGTEYAFLQFAASVNAPTPRPIVQDSTNNLAVYEFVEGRKLTAQELKPEHIRAAIDFISLLNSKRDSALAKALPAASEACFSINEHLQLVQRRVDRLKDIRGQEAIDQQAREFVSAELIPAWQKIRAQIEGQYTPAQLSATLPPQQRVISPSDFGFHNALLVPSGTLTFIDFEYAGWDDPAKLICDFFCQPAVPVDKQHFPEFAARILAKDVAAMKRSECLLPAYKIKWCCIMLNEFLPTSAARRDFAGAALEPKKIAQLQLSKTMHASIGSV